MNSNCEYVCVSLDVHIHKYENESTVILHRASSFTLIVRNAALSDCQFVCSHFAALHPSPPQLVCGSVCLNRTIWKASAARPVNVNRRRRNITPTGGCARGSERRCERGKKKSEGGRDGMVKCACWSLVGDRDENKSVHMCVCQVECSTLEQRVTPSVAMF